MERDKWNVGLFALESCAFVQIFSIISSLAIEVWKKVIIMKSSDGETHIECSRYVGEEFNLFLNDRQSVILFFNVEHLTVWNL